MKKDLTPAARARLAALDLLERLEFEESIAAYERHLKETPGEDIAALGGLARAYLAAGRYREAIPLFERVGLSEQKKLAGGINRRDVIAVLHWLLGERAVARTLIKEVVTGRLEGSIIYGDGAGGATQGLLLHYMAVSDGVTEDVQYAVDYLANRNFKRHFPRVGTVFPVLLAVNRALPGDQSPLALTIRTRLRAGSPFTRLALAPSRDHGPSASVGSLAEPSSCSP
ncbi:MAG: tetratricopeptide repeat protein, partial [Rickettsiales bacterium]|nr:tetratricopeptide repeat protein [Rickettsiales bacterium]